MRCRDEEDDPSHSMGSMHISRHNRKALQLQKGKKGNSSGLTTDFTLKEADTVFGRPSEWTSPANDIEAGRHIMSFVDGAHSKSTSTTTA